MSEINQAATIEKPLRKLRRKARQTGALAMVIGAAGGIAAPVAHAERSATASPKIERAGPQLINPAELPGIKIHLGKETLQKIKNSTVEIGSMYSPDIPGVWHGPGYSMSCTAVKVSIPGQKDALMTAAHCFGDITGYRFGAFTDSLNPSAKAENFAGQSDQSYAVLDPAEDQLDVRTTQPIAIIDSISISTDDRDVALLHVKAVDDSKISSPAIRRFADIPALPLKVAESAPLPGTPVALYGEPQANNFEARAGTGVYIGRVNYSYKAEHSDATVYRQLDLVGINPATPEEDNCNYGTSGSMALLPNGKLLGNLSFRTSHGYGPDRLMQPPDNQDFDAFWRAKWEQQLGIELDGFDTICGYTVLDDSTPQQLIRGISLPASPVGGKGGDPGGQG